jgi:hypothetical protein
MSWLALCCVAVVAADPPAVHRGVANELTVKPPRIEAEVAIDGALDEPEWSQAAVLTGFSEYAPTDGRPAAEETKVLVWYSPSAIYFGIRAEAPAGSVRATLSSRDHIDTDDQVQIFLSPFNDGRQSVMFAVNPLGVQADGALVEGTKTTSGLSGVQLGRENADLSPDFVFQSKGRITDLGFEVEVRIPFKSLRSPSSDIQDWGLHVVRIVKSTGHEDSWVPARRGATSFLGQAGTLSGLTGLRRGLVLDLTPVVTARAEGGAADAGWQYDANGPEFGGNVRWGVTPNLTLNGTVNPDFAEVEADAGQFVFDPRQALYYPEKRPFFLDGIEQFASPNQLIYTRRIVAPLGAVKLNGKVGGTTLALLSAVDDRGTSVTQDRHPVFNIARIQRDIGGESRLGLVYTDKTDGANSNRVFGVDTRLSFKSIYGVQLQSAVSRTEAAGQAATAPLWQAQFSRNGRTFGLRYLLNGVDEEFRADAGFISRTGIARATLDHRITAYGPKGGWFESWSNNAILEGVWQYDDFVHGRGAQDRMFHLGTNIALRKGWRVGGMLFFESFGFDEQLYEDYRLGQQQADGSWVYLPFVGTPKLPNLDVDVTVNTPQYKTVSANAFVLVGKDENFYEWSSARIGFVQGGVDWRPTEQIRVNGGYQLQYYYRWSDGTLVGRRQIPRLKLEYQLTRAIFFRFVGEYDASFQDDLRDDSRTELPIFYKVGSEHVRALGYERNRFRADWLFSYQPVPGTVFFAGYGSTLSEPEALRFRGLSRVNDGFFVKFSYLFRM